MLILMGGHSGERMPCISASSRPVVQSDHRRRQSNCHPWYAALAPPFIFFIFIFIFIFNLFFFNLFFFNLFFFNLFFFIFIFYFHFNFLEY